MSFEEASRNKERVASNPERNLAPDIAVVRQGSWRPLRWSGGRCRRVGQNPVRGRSGFASISKAAVCLSELVQNQ